MRTANRLGLDPTPGVAPELDVVEFAIPQELPVAGGAVLSAEDAIEEDSLQASGQPTILLELDPEVDGGSINGRIDLRLRGRVASTLGVEFVALSLDGRPAGRVEYSLSGHGKPTTLANGLAGHQHAFAFTVACALPEADGEHELCLRAAVADGTVREELFALTVDASGSKPVSILRGPGHAMRSVASHDAGSPPLLVYTERALVDASGRMLLHGWAVARNRVLTVQAFIGDERLPAARLGGLREDVAQHYPFYPNARTSGFVLTGQVSVTQVKDLRDIRVQAISFDGYLHEVVLPVERGVPAPELQVSAPEPEEPPQETPQSQIHYHCDESLFLPDGTLHVVGWAVCEAGLAEIEIKLDGERLGTAELGHPRPDVGEQYGNIEAARHAGFRFIKTLPGIAEGDHEVLITIRTQQNDSRSESRTVHADEPVRAAPAEPAALPPNELRFELDNPAVANGVALEPVTDRLTIEGWVLSRSGMAKIEIAMDDQPFGDALLGLARPDVGAAFPETEAAMRSGYAFHFPARALRNGEHVVKLTVVAKNGQSLEQSFRVTVNKSDTGDEFSSIRRRMSRVEAAMLADVLTGLQYEPEFRLLMLDNGNEAELQASLESLRSQVYPHWRVIAVSDADAGAQCDAPSEGGRPVLYGVMRAGDQLGCDALAEIAVAAAMHGADLVYADESRISSVSKEREAFFKPDFSPDLLLSTNYIGRAWFATAALIDRAGVQPAGVAVAGEYDAVLRCTEQARVIHHVPRLLMQSGADVPDADQDRAALQGAAARRGFAADVLSGCASGIYRLRRLAPATGKVSIIIPTCAAHGHIGNCIRGLREKTTYPNYEIVCIDNVPDSEPYWKQWVHDNADVIVDIPGAFNWSRFNNTAARATDGEYLLFLNDDTEIVNEDWLEALLEHAQRPDVGAVGALLLYPGGRIQHAGMMLGAGIGRHPFRFSPADEPGYFGLALTQRNVIAVTGACMLMRRTFFDELNGFEEAHSVINNDLDLCLRAHEAGKYVVFTPHATLIHHELASRDKLGDVFDTTQFDSRWRNMFAAGDPYYHPLLSRHHDDYRVDGEPTQAVFCGHPLFERSEIRRILVVKLDHIGDFITALPPIRRLKSLFPEASITVLAGRAARAFVGLEPAIDEYLEFEFFHARSALGEKQLTEEDFAALHARLAPYRFDLAVDLRKHLSTRTVLRHTGARFLAGFDYMGQFPFLDIAVEWDGDRKLQRKRNHVVDDLLGLVEAIDTACLETRNLIDVPPPPLPLEQLPSDVQALFERPVVVVHGGAGNITKEWPALYFTALIDLLIAHDGVNVLLVGGPDDRPRAEEIQQTVLVPARVGSVTGMLGLADLPRLLVRCVLYIGNDSGPKHIAAGVGVPTLGIHSGVVDPVEWGPLGRRSVAMRRNMNCSPCYLASADDCPRNLACLRFLEPSIVYRTARMMLGRRVGEVTAVPEQHGGQTGKLTAKAGKATASRLAKKQRPDRKRRGGGAINAGEGMIQANRVPSAT